MVFVYRSDGFRKAKPGNIMPLRRTAEIYSRGLPTRDEGRERTCWLSQTSWERMERRLRSYWNRCARTARYLILLHDSLERYIEVTG